MTALTLAPFAPEPFEPEEIPWHLPEREEVAESMMRIMEARKMFAGFLATLDRVKFAILDGRNDPAKYRDAAVMLNDLQVECGDMIEATVGEIECLTQDWYDREHDSIHGKLPPLGEMIAGMLDQLTPPRPALSVVAEPGI